MQHTTFFNADGSTKKFGIESPEGDNWLAYLKHPGTSP